VGSQVSISVFWNDNFSGWVKDRLERGNFKGKVTSYKPSLVV
jgi:hypothetical protein